MPPSPPPSSDPWTTATYTQLSTRRSPKPLQQLDLTLLHSPLVASGWSSFLGSIRTQTSLPADIRELCICRIAVLNGADYEWEHHVPILREAGVGERAVEEIKSRKAWRGWRGEEADAVAEEEDTRHDEYGALNEKQRAVLAYTDAMTIGVKVSDGIFAELRKRFDEREVVEITATVAAYNCVSRFLVALDVGEMSEKKE
ncbi:MAG: hypothetical protein ASARMPREDX12_006402 [Alectoria sarmentosa]|nr:MAG: hypothetical protein ASARMPREDX12_006402 [Alectoria sarmentosa]